jgi:hypothetical protein
MEQESREWEPSPFGELSSIETHVSTSPPLGLALLDPIQEVIFLMIVTDFILSSYFLFELGSSLVFNLFLVSFGYVFSVGNSVPRF